MPAQKTPRLNIAVRKAGATKVQRNGPRSFAVGFRLVIGDASLPGRGPLVVATLAAAFPSATVIWGGTQADAIFLRFDA